MVTEIDHAIFQHIHQWTQQDSFMNSLMQFFANYAIYILIIGLLLYGLTRPRRNLRLVVETVIASGMVLTISKIIELYFHRERPFIEFDIIPLITHTANASFPSNHALGSFVIATVFCLNRKRYGWLWFVLAFLISFSRVWVGVHYPSDIVGGIIIGIAGALLIHFIITKWSWASRMLSK